MSKVKVVKKYLETPSGVKIQIWEYGSYRIWLDVHDERYRWASQDADTDVHVPTHGAELTLEQAVLACVKNQNRYRRAIGRVD